MKLKQKCLKKQLRQMNLLISLITKQLLKKIIAHVQEGRFKLLEVLTKSILELIMKDKKVKWARVEVDKPHALRFAESVSVELEASR